MCKSQNDMRKSILMISALMMALSALGGQAQVEVSQGVVVPENEK
jgi:hypothetical protein